MKLLHGSRAPLALHVGLCLTDSREAARSYAREGGRITQVELAMAGLRVVEVEAFGAGETADAAGDTETEIAALAAEGVDVVTYDDEAIGLDDTHRTWRIVSARALAAVKVLGPVR